MKKCIITEYNEAELQSLIETSIRKILSEEFPKLLSTLNNSPPTSQNEKFLSRKELKSYLNISLPTIAKLTKEGLLKATIIGGSYRYRESDVIKSFKNNERRKA